jgi:rhodanese-related sulfurtransferase
MYGLFGRGSIRDLMPEEVAEGLAADKILLIDVREPNETASERIRGAVLALSTPTLQAASRPGKRRDFPSRHESRLRRHVRQPGARGRFSPGRRHAREIRGGANAGNGLVDFGSGNSANGRAAPERGALQLPLVRTIFRCWRRFQLRLRHL